MNRGVYRGESVTIVVRCHDRSGNGLNVEGLSVYAVLADRRGRVVWRFEPDSPAVEKTGSYLMLHCEEHVTSAMHGSYTLEIRLRDTEGITRIAQLPGVKFWDTVIGKSGS